MGYRIGVDIGGTKVAVGFVDSKNNLFCKTEFPTRLNENDKLDPEEFAKRIYDNTVRFMKEKGITFEDVDSMGVGVPGTVDAVEGTILYANNLDFINVPFVSMLEDIFNLPVAIENDANVACLAEYVEGAAKNQKPESMIMVTLGTGVGAGFIFNYQLYSGYNMGAGEIGHMVIDVHGKPCNCGRRGCFENYASASALMEDAKAAMEQNPDSVLNTLSQKTGLDGKVFFEAVRQKDETALEVFEKYMTYLSAGIINIINSLQPEMLVIGGGISGAGDILLKPLQREVDKYIYTRDSMKQTKIVQAKLGNEAGVLGAALLIDAI